MQDVDLWSAVVVANNQGLESLFEQVDQLSVDEKAELVKRLLHSSNLNVTFGSSHLSGNIIVQINTMDKSSLSDILQAIADRISKDGVKAV